MNFFNILIIVICSSGMLNAGDFQKSKKPSDLPLLIQLVVGLGTTKHYPQTNINEKSLYEKDNKGRTALHLAASVGKSEFVGILIKAGIAVNIQDNEEATPLHHACLNAYHAAMRELLKNSANLYLQTKSGETVFDWLFKTKDKNSPGRGTFFKELLTHVQNPTILTVGKAVHHYSYTYDDASVFDRFKELELLEIPDKHKSTPLFFAVRGNNISGVRTLLERGAKPNHINEYGQTPLGEAIKQKHLFIIRILTNYGANPMPFIALEKYKEISHQEIEKI